MTPLHYAFDGREADENNAELNYHLTQHDSGLTVEELDRLVEIGDKIQLDRAQLFGQTQPLPERIDFGRGHFLLSEETRWFYDRMAEVTKRINEESYQYDLSGFHEPFYYLRYETGEHFSWHHDMSGATEAPRKLTMVLQLNEPFDYDGGEFEVAVAGKHQQAVRQRGIITAFPSYKIHRVTPVTRGARRVITMIASGPNFR